MAGYNVQPSPTLSLHQPFDLKANRYFFLEVPPLGEIDFVWKWVEGPKPREGYYKIDIYDMVLACGAYGSSGNGIPSPNWFPGADLAPEECKIDIFDIVAICSGYERNLVALHPTRKKWQLIETFISPLFLKNCLDTGCKG